MIIKLSKPYEFEGKKITELTLDFEALSGRDIIAVETEASSIAGRPVLDIDKTYQACLAAKAAGVVYDLILGLPAKDFIRVIGPAQNFLLDISVQEIQPIQ
ncbi:phage tail assembly protein [Candidatus Saccharibacteria bacterium]|nr:phage tail assembly protein [Candidatus Saccharibacteria bacterium]